MNEFQREACESVLKHNYSAYYNGRTFYSDDTADLAEQIADHIGENVKADISDASA